MVSNAQLEIWRDGSGNSKHNDPGHIKSRLSELSACETCYHCLIRHQADAKQGPHQVIDTNYEHDLIDLSRREKP